MMKVKRRTWIKSMGSVLMGLLFYDSAKGGGINEQKKEDFVKKTTDVLIIGGGTAGVIAAIQSARAGRNTIIVESFSHPGGTMTKGGVNFPGLFHAWGEQIIGGIGWELVKETVEMNGDKMPEFTSEPERHWYNQIPINNYLYTLLAEEKCKKAGVQIRYYETPINLSFQNDKWIVTTIGKGIQTQITCNQIIDCTGNAYATQLAGFNLLKESNKQPGALIFEIAGYDFESLDLKNIPKRYRNILRSGYIAGKKDLAKLYVPYNQITVNGADSTTSESHTNANIKGRSSLLEMLRSLKSLPGCEKIKIVDMQPETAVRETYRIDGVYKITYSDYISGKVFDDALSYSFYPIDLHRENKSIHQEYLNKGVVATIPLRALIPKGSKNFLIAGRCVSSDRMANSALRVQASCMGMGQAAGSAAALASKYNTTPSELPVEDIKNLIRENKGIVPM